MCGRGCRGCSGQRPCLASWARGAQGRCSLEHHTAQTKQQRCCSVAALLLCLWFVLLRTSLEPIAWNSAATLADIPDSRSATRRILGKSKIRVLSQSGHMIFWPLWTRGVGTISLYLPRSARVAYSEREICLQLGFGAELAVGEAVILLHPPLPSVGFSIGMARGYQHNRSLATRRSGSTRRPRSGPTARCARSTVTRLGHVYKPRPKMSLGRF